MFAELTAAITDGSVFMDSVQLFFSQLSINHIIVCIMVVFMVIGGIDQIRGNKLGYGEKFTEGFHALGPLAIAMLGIITLAPVLRVLLEPLIRPMFQSIGADPSVFAGCLLGCDMGGYPLALELTNSQSDAYFSGLIVACMMGAVIVFTIPVALNLIEEKDRVYLALGVLIGMITIPLGCVAGGLLMNMTPYKLSVRAILLNTIPIFVFACLIALGLWFYTNKMLKGFLVFGRAINIMITIGTMVAVFQYLTGIRFPLFHLMVEADEQGVIPLENGIMIVGKIAFVLIGAFPMVFFITKTFSKQLVRLGSHFQLNEISCAGLIANLANNILVFEMMKDMDAKGKLLNCTFAVSAAFVLGDHLGFVAGVDQEMILPMIVGKLTAGLSALLIANIFASKLLAFAHANK